MKLAHVAVPLLVVAFIASFTVSASADDGSAIFKNKCAVCHGAEGQGKIGPALKGTSVTADQIADMLTKGNDAKKMPHKKPLAGLSTDDAKAVAAFVKTLK
jgi:mono/diheme cytochrome c family protein